MDPKHSQGPDRVDYQENAGDVTDVHAALVREHPEPTAQVTPIPMWLTAVCGVAILWAGLYLGLFHGGFKGDVFNENQSSPELLFPSSTSTGPALAVVANLTLAQQGAAVYVNCQPCHQPNGLGLPNQYPPLAKSEWANGSEKRVIAILLKGITGQIAVEGKTFNGAMPAWEKTLSDKKIAAVASYVRSSFGNTAPEISEAKVAAARKEFASKADSWTQAQLEAIPADATLPDAAGAAPAAGAAAPAGTGTAPAPASGGSAAPPAAGAPATPPAPAPAPAGAAPVTPVTPTAPPLAAAAAPAPATNSTAAMPAPAPAAGSAPATAAAGANEEPPAEQMAAGKTQYMTVCFVCHQPTGLGLPPVFPPLAKSPYVNGSAERLVAMILKGNIGPFTLDGKAYNNIMPPQEAIITDDAKIAAVATYVRNSFGNKASAVSKDLVTKTRQKFTERKAQWTQVELDAWKD